jgi:hypothetical protein
MPNLTLLRARNLLKKGYKGFPSRINIIVDKNESPFVSLAKTQKRLDRF